MARVPTLAVLHPQPGLLGTAALAAGGHLQGVA
jgi:glucokinase